MQDHPVYKKVVILGNAGPLPAYSAFGKDVFALLLAYCCSSPGYIGNASLGIPYNPQNSLLGGRVAIFDSFGNPPPAVVEAAACALLT